MKILILWENYGIYLVKRHDISNSNDNICSINIKMKEKERKVQKQGTVLSKIDNG